MSSQLKQIVLPYFDAVSEEEGLQFGVPAEEPQDSFAPKAAAGSARSDVVLFPLGSEPFRMHQPVFEEAAQASESEAQLPRPNWAWSLIKAQGELWWSRPGKPTRRKGSLPLEQLSERSVEPLGGSRLVFCTPVGLRAYGLEPTLFDLPHEMLVSGLEPGITTLEAGGHTLAMLHVSEAGSTEEERPLLAIEPTKKAVESGLWTAHLVRLTEVLHCTESNRF